MHSRSINHLENVYDFNFQHHYYSHFRWYYFYRLHACSVPANQFTQLMAAINRTQARLDTKLADFRDQIARNEQPPRLLGKYKRCKTSMFSSRRVMRSSTKLTLLLTKPYTRLKLSWMLFLLTPLQSLQ